MLFCSARFLVFFPAVVLLYFVVPRRVRMYWLLAVSYYFYMCWNPTYALLMLASTIITFISGLLIERCSHSEEPQVTKLKKMWVALSFVLNLAILFFFKYFDFAVDSLVSLLSTVGISIKKPVFDILLPVGISFYTFQALSYTMDVYRGDLTAEKNFFRYALFVSFFPQLVAGPIERSKNLLSQLKQPTVFSFERMRNGLLMMLWGFFLKLVIADRAAIVVNTVYDAHSMFIGWPLLLATMLFAIQIYCDFAGYSAIAIGAAEVLGIKLMQNFRQPYLSSSISDFWRRWHISLSTWFRDYLYIPMGGNRCSAPRRCLNLMVTFAVSGAWHGANWTFIVWGILNGFFQLGEMWLKRLINAVKKHFSICDPYKNTFSRKLLKVLVTFGLINITWVFFRAETLNDAVSILVRMFNLCNPWVLTDGTLYKLGLDVMEFWLLLAAIGVLLAVDITHEKGIRLRERLYRQELWFRWAVYLIALFGIIALGLYGSQYDASAFIYFQF